MKVSIFTQGDANSMTSWSGVPYFLSKGLEQLGVEVNRIDMSPRGNFYRFCNILWKDTAGRCIKLFDKKNIYSFARSKVHNAFVYRRIKKAYKENPCEWNIFLTFSFYNKFGGKSLLLCDWSFDYEISEKRRKKPNFKERQYIKYERNVIANSEKVVSIFPYYADAMSRLYDREVLYLGSLGVNNLPENWLLDDSVLDVKRDSKKIVFVGKSLYKDACKLVIEAFRKLKGDFELHVIGMERFGDYPENVHFHGMLSKNIPEERMLYYDLLKEAKLCVNMSYYGGFGAATEAMSAYTPLIINVENKELSSVFGNEIGFGEYVEFDADKVAAAMERICLSEDYHNYALAARKAVSEMTWERYCKELIKVIS